MGIPRLGHLARESPSRGPREGIPNQDMIGVLRGALWGCLMMLAHLPKRLPRWVLLAGNAPRNAPFSSYLRVSP